MPNKFRAITDDLFQTVSHDELAQEIGCSVALIRQARRDEGTASFRNAPVGYIEAVRTLAEKQAAHFTKLAKRLSSG